MVKRYSKTIDSYRKSSRHPKAHLDSRNAPVSQITRSFDTGDGLKSLRTLHDALPEDVQRSTDSDNLEVNVSQNEATHCNRCAVELDNKPSTSEEIQEDGTHDVSSENDLSPVKLPNVRYQEFPQVDTETLKQILQKVQEIQGQELNQEDLADSTTPEFQATSSHPPHNSPGTSFQTNHHSSVPQGNNAHQQAFNSMYPGHPSVMWVPVCMPAHPPPPALPSPCPDCGCRAGGFAPQCRSSQSLQKSSLQPTKRDLFDSALYAAKTLVGRNVPSSTTSPAKSDSSSSSSQSQPSKPRGTFLLEFHQTTVLAFAYEIDNEMDKDVFNCEHLAHLLFVPPSVIKKWFENRRETSFLMRAKGENRKRTSKS